MEEWTGKDKTGSSHGLFQATIQHLPVGPQRNNKTPQWG